MGAVNITIMENDDCANPGDEAVRKFNGGQSCRCTTRSLSPEVRRLYTPEPRVILRKRLIPLTKACPHFVSDGG